MKSMKPAKMLDVEGAMVMPSYRSERGVLLLVVDQGWEGSITVVIGGSGVGSVVVDTRWEGKRESLRDTIRLHDTFSLVAVKTMFTADRK